MRALEAERAVANGRTELARFLRARREGLTPEDVGITTSRSRRTPGLRREEVAFLADIGVKWYARLEMGGEVHPSPKTLTSIAHALRLNRVDMEYLFALAGLTAPREQVGFNVDVPEPLSKLTSSFYNKMAAVTDLFLTPLRWNAITDAVWQCSSFPTRLERNILVRTFVTDVDSIKEYTGDEYEDVLRNAAGVFRRHFMADDSDSFARQLYERLRDSPLFQRIWEECTVTDWLNASRRVVRHHPIVGTLRMMPLDLQFPHRNDLILKLWLPDDDETGQKFKHLEKIGRPWSPDIDTFARPF